VEDPNRYLRKVAANFLDFFNHFSVEAYLLKGIVAVAVLAAVLHCCIIGRSVLPLLGLPLLWLALTLGRVEDWHGIVTMTLAGGLVFLVGGSRARAGVLIMLVFLVGSGILSGLVGNFAIHRGLPLVHWMFVMLVVAAAVSLARVSATLLLRLVPMGEGRRLDSRIEPPAGDPWRGAPAWMVSGLCAFLVIGAAGLCLRTILAAPTPEADRVIQLDRTERERVIEAVFDGLSGGEALDRSLVFCEPVCVNHYRWDIGKNIDVGHWSRMFERRPYDRTAAFLEKAGHYPSPPGRIAGQFRGDLTQVGQLAPYVAVGLKNVDPDAPLGDEVLMVEGVALIPYDEKRGAAVLNQMLRYPLTPEAEELLGNPSR
jgi:hypothetical protein